MDEQEARTLLALALSWFWPEPRPRPDWYTLTYEADGYIATDIAGGAGELIKDPAKPGRFEFSYRLPPVRLRPADAAASNQALERPGASSSAASRRRSRPATQRCNC